MKLLHGSDLVPVGQAPLPFHPDQPLVLPRTYLVRIGPLALTVDADDIVDAIRDAQRQSPHEISAISEVRP